MKSKIAIVTGAGTGIGKAVSLALGEIGFQVYVVGRRKDLLEKTAKQGGEGFHVHSCDLTDESETKKLFERVITEKGRLDLLFNNAGTSAKALPPDELDLTEWKKVIDINLNSVFDCCRHAFKIMKSQSPIGGRIINNGSISADTPRPFSAPYTASKHAITGLTKALSLDGREFNICVGQIDIGNAATEMTIQMSNAILQADGSLKSEPRIDTAHVAEAVCYMAQLPLTVNCLRLNVMANRMPFVGRG